MPPDPESSFSLDFIVSHPDFLDEEERLEQLAERACALTLRFAPKHLQNAGVSIVLGDDAFLQDLNLTFREKDTPTNVLSFPADEEDYMGDIAISADMLMEEASEQGKVFDDHFVHMVVHAMLHLYGYDHEQDNQAEEMELLEIRILSEMHIENPYFHADTA